MFGIKFNKSTYKSNEKRISNFPYSFWLDDKYLYFKGVGPEGFRILFDDITSVSVDVNPQQGPLESTMRVLKINGHGTLLGQAKVSMGFAEKAQDFIIEELKKTNDSEPSTQAVPEYVRELEALAVLKDKGVISQDEFDQKKKQLLQ